MTRPRPCNHVMVGDAPWCDKEGTHVVVDAQGREISGYECQEHAERFARLLRLQRGDRVSVKKA